MKKQNQNSIVQKYQLAVDDFALFSVTDVSGKIIYINEMFCQVSGYSKDELIGTNHSVLKSGLMDQKFYQDLWKKLLAGETWKGQFCNRRKDGNLFWVESTILPVKKKNKVVEFISIHREITKQKIEEQELLKSKEEALAATKIKSQFLANMSHEIRTPMNGIIGMSDLLLGYVTEKEVVEKLKIIQSCGHTLLDLVNDVLDFSKLEVDKIELQDENFLIHENVTNIIEIIKAKSEKEWIKVIYEKDLNIPETVCGDLTRVRQVLLNLISNAFKFTEKGEIKVSSKLVSIIDGVIKVQFSVKDTGIGIPEHLKEKLFKSFSQVDGSMTRKYGGTGLGLSISKGLCEKMGGQIWVDSKPNEGSTFHFTFNAQLASRVENQKDYFSEKTEEKISPTEYSKRFPLKVLIAEDNKVNQVVITGILEKFGYRPDIANDGVEVLKYLENQNYDLILMDCHMPEMDGFESTKQIILKFPDAKYRPEIFAVTASSTQEDKDRCLKVGMDGFISKPVTIEKIESAIKNVINKKGLQFIFDYNQFQKQMDFDTVLMKQIVKVFLDSYTAKMNDLETSISQQKIKETEETAHALKGMFANLSAESLRKTCEEIEHIAKQGTFKNAKNLFRQLKKELSLLLDELKLIKDYNKIDKVS